MAHTGLVLKAEGPEEIRRRRMAALDELLGEAEFRLIDAEELATSAARARKAEAERISRADVEAYRAQVDALHYARLLLEREAAAERAAA